MFLQILDKSDEILTIKHRKPQLDRNLSLSDAFANVAAALLADNKRKKKKKLFSEPLLGRFREQFKKIHRRRAMSLPVGLDGKTEKKLKKKALFHVGSDSGPVKPKLQKSASCGVERVTT